MSALIIGAGLIGSQIARILVERGETPIIMDFSPQRAALGEIVDLKRVHIIEGDVMRPLQISKAICDHAVTEIVHTVSNPMLTLGAQKDPYSAIQLNIMGTVNVLEAARVHGVKRVVVSSSNVLNHFLAGGEGGGDPMKEEGFPRPTTFYASTKHAIENLGLNYARWCAVDFAAVRYAAVCGPWSGHGGGGPSNIMREAVSRALRSEEAVVPAARLEWVYSKDAALGTVLALKAANLGSRIFNISMESISGPEDLSAAIVAAVPGAKVKIETAAADAVAIPQVRRNSDQSLARSVLGFKPEFDMPSAVRDLAQWLRQKMK